jgi:hypothetical protein
MSTAERYLNTNVLSFIGQLAAEGRYAALISLGAREDQIPRLSTLSFVDMATLGGCPLSASLVQARIDPVVLDLLFLTLERKQRESECIRRLMLAGASQRLMEELTGMEAARYADYRRVLSLRGADNGRPKELLRARPSPRDSEEATRIWRAWRESASLDEIERWLRVHEATGQSLRVIERVIRSPELHLPTGSSEQPNPSVDEATHGRR